MFNARGNELSPEDINRMIGTVGCAEVRMGDSDVSIEMTEDYAYLTAVDEPLDRDGAREVIAALWCWLGEND